MGKIIVLLTTLIASVNFGSGARIIPSSTVIDSTTSLDNFVSLGEWNTDGNLENWTPTRVTNFAAYGGCATGTVSGADMHITLHLLDNGKYLNLVSGSVIEVRRRFDTNTVSSFSAIYLNATDYVIEYANNTNTPIDGNFHTFTTTILTNFGAVSYFRDDQLSSAADGETFSVDYIRVKSPIMIDPTNANEAFFSYTSIAEWNTNDDFEGWTLTGYSNNSEVIDGLLKATTVSTSGRIDKNSDMAAVNLDENKILECRFKHSQTGNTAVDYYYATVNNPILGEDKKPIIPYTYVPHDGAFHVYQYDLSGDTNWESTLSALRFRPTRINDDDVEIDYIRVGRIVIPEPCLFIISYLLIFIYYLKR